MKALSNQNNHSHYENGKKIQFVNGVFVTEDTTEKKILEKYNGACWRILPEPKARPKNKTEKKETTPQVPEIKPELKLEGLSRQELYKMAKDKGYTGKYIESSVDELMEFLKNE